MTLYRRGRIWWTEYEVAGKTYRRSTGETSKVKALGIEQRIVADRYDVKSLSRLHDMRIGEALNRYLETVLLKKPRNQDGSLRKSTKVIVAYLRRIEQHFGRKAPLAFLCRPGVIADYNRTLLRSMKPNSANKYLTYLRAVINRAYDWGALEYQPRINLNSVRWAKNRYLSPAEEKTHRAGLSPQNPTFDRVHAGYRRPKG